MKKPANFFFFKIKKVELNVLCVVLSFNVSLCFHILIGMVVIFL